MYPLNETCIFFHLMVKFTQNVSSIGVSPVSGYICAGYILKITF